MFKKEKLPGVSPIGEMIIGRNSELQNKQLLKNFSFI